MPRYTVSIHALGALTGSPARLQTSSAVVGTSASVSALALVATTAAVRKLRVGESVRSVHLASCVSATATWSTCQNSDPLT